MKIKSTKLDGLVNTFLYLVRSVSGSRTFYAHTKDQSWPTPSLLSLGTHLGLSPFRCILCNNRHLRYLHHRKSCIYLRRNQSCTRRRFWRGCRGGRRSRRWRTCRHTCRKDAQLPRRVVFCRKSSQDDAWPFLYSYLVYGTLISINDYFAVI